MAVMSHLNRLSLPFQPQTPTIEMGKPKNTMGKVDEKSGGPPSESTVLCCGSFVQTAADETDLQTRNSTSNDFHPMTALTKSSKIRGSVTETVASSR